MLAEQVQLFDSEEQIISYIETEKLLAHNVEEKLTELSKTLMLLSSPHFQKNRLVEEIELFSEMQNSL